VDTTDFEPVKVPKAPHKTKSLQCGRLSVGTIQILVNTSEEDGLSASVRCDFNRTFWRQFQ
jgi:hypothetical protein